MTFYVNKCNENSKPRLLQKVSQYLSSQYSPPTSQPVSNWMSCSDDRASQYISMSCSADRASHYISMSCSADRASQYISMSCSADRASQYISTVKPTWCTFYSVYWELRVSTCFEHYLLILRRCFTSSTWYIACVLCQLAAPGLEWNSNPGAANWHNTHAIYQVPLVQRFLRMSK
jgi:hypothetical protein